MGLAAAVKHGTASKAGKANYKGNNWGHWAGASKFEGGTSQQQMISPGPAAKGGNTVSCAPKKGVQGGLTCTKASVAHGPFGSKVKVK